MGGGLSKRMGYLGYIHVIYEENHPKLRRARKREKFRTLFRTTCLIIFEENSNTRIVTCRMASRSWCWSRRLAALELTAKINYESQEVCIISIIYCVESYFTSTFFTTASLVIRKTYTQPSQWMIQYDAYFWTRISN